ncbi:MAG: hypothetical protein ACSLFD_02335 [Solirubrobacterales bacterium]
MKLFVENTPAPDGAEHLLEVGEFHSFRAMALASYVHMNGPVKDGPGPSDADLSKMAEAIERVTGGGSPVFGGISENNEPFSFYVDFDS